MTPMELDRHQDDDGILCQDKCDYSTHGRHCFRGSRPTPRGTNGPCCNQGPAVPFFFTRQLVISFLSRSTKKERAPRAYVGCAMRVQGLPLAVFSLSARPSPLRAHTGPRVSLWHDRTPSSSHSSLARRTNARRT